MAEKVGSCATTKCKNQDPKTGECKLGIDCDNDVIIICAEFEFGGYYD